MTKLIRLGATGAVLALVAASAIADARQAGSPFGAEGSRQPRQPWHHTPSSKRSHHSASAAAAPRTAHKSQAGSASYYANRFHGRKTASGRPYHKDAMTAAHRTLPLGTWVRVTSVRNNRSVVVQINDRGPYYGGRIIDLSRAAATELDMIHSGTARVHLEILKEPEKTGPAPDRSDLIIAYN